MDRLRISENRRYFVKEDGTPFTWLADTDWTMPLAMKWDDALYLMQTRKEQGFTVLQIVALDLMGDDPEMHNPVGETAFIDGDVDRPNEKYFEYLDRLLDAAGEIGLYVLLLPVWAHLVVGHDWGGKTFDKTITEENAYAYGRWFGDRYKDRKNVIWCLGGDRMPVDTGVDYRNVWRRLAEGLGRGVTGRELRYDCSEGWEEMAITYHPCHEAETGECSTMSYWTEEDAWISFIMIQSGHGIKKNYDIISKEYGRARIMPVWDGEPAYEMMPAAWPIDKNTPFHGSWMVRKRAYWALLAGAFGHTYGHASVWSSIDEKRQSAFFKHTWFEGLHSEGAQQIKYLRAFMDDMQPQLGRPCQEILPADNEDAPIDSHLQACVNGQNESVCVYFPSGGCAELDLCRVWEQEEVWLWWYRPCDGKFYADAETVTDTAQRRRTEGGRLPVCAPSSGACEDWLLLIKKEDSRAPIQVKTYYETKRVMEIKKVFEW